MPITPKLRTLIKRQSGVRVIESHRHRRLERAIKANVVDDVGVLAAPVVEVDVPALADVEGGVAVEGLLCLGGEAFADLQGWVERCCWAEVLFCAREMVIVAAGVAAADRDAVFWNEGVDVDLIPDFSWEAEEGSTL